MQASLDVPDGHVGPPEDCSSPLRLQEIVLPNAPIDTAGAAAALLRNGLMESIRQQRDLSPVARPLRSDDQL